jgi:hypothetical protein
MENTPILVLQPEHPNQWDMDPEPLDPLEDYVQLSSLVGRSLTIEDRRDLSYLTGRLLSTGDLRLTDKVRYIQLQVRDGLTRTAAVSLFHVLKLSSKDGKDIRKLVQEWDSPSKTSLSEKNEGL